MNSIYVSQASWAASQLFLLQLARCKKLGIDVFEVREFGHGGEYDLAELMYQHGIPEVHGKKEKEMVRQAFESSKAVGVIAY